MSLPQRAFWSTLALGFTLSTATAWAECPPLTALAQDLDRASAHGRVLHELAQTLEAARHLRAQIEALDSEGTEVLREQLKQLEQQFRLHLYQDALRRMVPVQDQAGE